MRFLIYGLIWLFIFAFPLSADKKLFDVAYKHIVKSKPVDEITSYISNIFQKTTIPGTIKEEIKQ